MYLNPSAEKGQYLTSYQVSPGVLGTLFQSPACMGPVELSWRLNSEAVLSP